MKEDCKSAWRVEKSRQDLPKVAPAASAIILEKADKAKQEAECRMLMFVTKLKTISTFYSADLMTRVFASSNVNGDGEGDVPSTSKSIKEKTTFMDLKRKSNGQEEDGKSSKYPKHSKNVPIFLFKKT